MRAATKLRAEQISNIAYVDNELPEPPPVVDAKPPEGGEGGKPLPTPTPPPHPTRPYPGIDGAVIVLQTTYGEIVVVAKDGVTFAKRVSDREPVVNPQTAGTMTAAGQPVYPSAGGGSLGQPSQLPADNKILATDWIVTDYNIAEDKEIVQIIDNETFTKHFKISLSG